MAKHHHLEIYNDLFKLTNHIASVRMQMSTAYKHDLGSRTFDAALNCQRILVRANASIKKSHLLLELLVEIDILWTYFRICYQNRAISQGTFKILCQQLRSLGEQASRWQKWSEKKEGG